MIFGFVYHGHLMDVLPCEQPKTLVEQSISNTMRASHLTVLGAKRLKAQGKLGSINGRPYSIWGMGYNDA